MPSPNPEPVAPPPGDAVADIMALIDEATCRLMRRNEACRQSGHGCFEANEWANDAHERLESTITALVRERDLMRPVVEAARAVVASRQSHYISFADEEPEWIEAVDLDETTILEHAIEELDAATAPPTTKETTDG